jgi:hypothetical protein
VERGLMKGKDAHVDGCPKRGVKNPIMKNIMKEVSYIPLGSR